MFVINIFLRSDFFLLCIYVCWWLPAKFVLPFLYQIFGCQAVKNVGQFLYLSLRLRFAI